MNIVGPAALVDIEISDEEDEKVSTLNIRPSMLTNSTQSNNNKDIYDKSCQFEKVLTSMPSIDDYPLPNLNSLLTSETFKIPATTNNIPNISGLLRDTEIQEESYIDSSESANDTISNTEIPNFDVLDDVHSGNITSQSNIPMLSALINDLPQLSISNSNLIDFNSINLD